MHKFVVVSLSCLLLTTTVFGQKKKTNSRNTNSGNNKEAIAIDSTIESDAKDVAGENIPVVSIDDGDMGDASSQNISSILTAGRDPFFQLSSFHFNPVRFRFRGYNSDEVTTLMNGVPMENLDNGWTPFGLWGGLNDVTRNRDFAIGMMPNTFSFGDLATATNFDVRASRQRKQTQIGYAYSNRIFNHRTSITHSSGMTKEGWAYTASASMRYSDEGYFPGTYYNSISWFAAIDKKLNAKNLLSLVAFNANTENGRQLAAQQEVFDIKGTNYNPAWGYQMGKKRNGYVAKTSQPVFILSHEYKPNNNTVLNTGISFITGERSSSTIDWFNSPDPRPNYYRYLPSYYLFEGNTIAYNAVNDQWKNNPNSGQIQWDKFFEANRWDRNFIPNSSRPTGFDTFTRSRYIVGENVVATNRINLNTLLNTKLSEGFDFTAGLSYQSQINHNFKKVSDLLGGGFWKDFNQFAELTYPSNGTAQINNLLDTGMKRVGDKYGYNYEMHLRKTTAWSQLKMKFNKVDVFVAAEYSRTEFWRNGLFQNGIFQNNSLGKSASSEFNNYAVKLGFTYKINGRNYLYFNGMHRTRAPLFENVFISPSFRDTKQNNVQNEEITSVEGGYILNAPRVKMRISGFYTEFRNQMDVIRYFDDQYTNFVNLAINNIGKVNYGLEWGFEVKPLANITVEGALSLGNYFYNTRQFLTTTVDNSAALIASDSANLINYRLGGTPQTAASLGVTYRSPKYWYVGLTYSYFDEMYVEPNPVKRTYRAVMNAQTNKERQDILAQKRLPSQFVLDANAGYSWRLPRNFFLGSQTFLVFNFNVNNILDNQRIIAASREQLRFDFKGGNAEKFPSLFVYSMGLNYSASVALRF